MVRRHPLAQFLVSNGMLAAAGIVIFFAARLIDGPAGIAADLSIGLSLVCIHVILAIGLLLVAGTSGQISLGQAAFYGIGAYAAAAPLATRTLDPAQPMEMLAFYVSAGISAAVTIAALAVITLLIRLSRRLIGVLPPILLCALVAWGIADLVITAQIGNRPYLIWSQTWPTIQSLHGLILQAIAPAERADGSIHLGMLILMAAGATTTGTAAWAISLATGNRSSLYVVLFTLALALAVRGSLWQTGPVALHPSDDLPIFTWCAIAALLAVVAIWRIVHSQIGRATEAVREDAIAAATVGIHPGNQRRRAMVIGAALAGIAGALRTQIPRDIEPNEFGLASGIALLAIVVIGGMRSISGVVIAAVLLSMIPAFWPGAQAAWYGLLAIGMIAALRWQPAGLLGNRELWPPRLRRRSADPTPEATS